MAFRMLTPAQRWLWVSWILALPVAADDAPVYGQLTAGTREIVSVPPTDGVAHYGWRGAKTGTAPLIPRLFDRPVPLFPPLFQHRSPDHPARHVGFGEPLVGTSWLNRPFHAGWLVGGLFGDDLIAGQVDQDEDIFGGYRLGWDFDHYWGSELRFAFATSI